MRSEKEEEKEKPLKDCEKLEVGSQK